MIRGVKLRKLFEQSMDRTYGNGVPSYRQQIRTLLGIRENADEHGRTRIVESERAVHPKEFSLAETAYELLGPSWTSQISESMAHAHNYRATLREAEGGQVLPSTFANISAYVDTVSGLIEAMVLDRFESPAYIGDSVVDVVPTRVNGGKMIGVLNDGTGAEDDLEPGEPLPMVGLKETYVDIPDNQRFGAGIQLNEQTFIYDRTDQIQSAAEAAGDSTLRRKEIRIADRFLGIVNDYSRDGSSSNTYLTTDGTAPNDFTNSSTNQLVNLTDIDNAIQVLEGNTDPGTGFEITVVKPEFAMMVMPQNTLNARSILRATEIRETTDTNLVTLTPYQNLLPNFQLIEASRIWYNRLIDNSVSESNAINRWHLFHPRKFMGYRELVPYRFRTAPIGAGEMRRGISYVAFVDEHGVSFIKEPRYAYQGTEE